MNVYAAVDIGTAHVYAADSDDQAATIAGRFANEAATIHGRSCEIDLYVIARDVEQLPAVPSSIGATA